MTMLLPADLRLRLAAAFILVVALSQLRDLATAAVALAAVGMIVLAARPAKGVWRRLLHLETFVLLLFLTLPFTVAGRPVLELGPLTASAEGVSRAALIACKVSACVLVLLTFLGGIEPDRLGSALRGLRFPEPLVRMFVLTVRYLGLIREEAGRLHDSMRARGFTPGTNRHTFNAYGNLIGMLLVRALDRARRVEEAMLCRGYQGCFPYAVLPAPATRDWAGFAAVATLAVTVLVFDRL